MQLRSSLTIRANIIVFLRLQSPILLWMVGESAIYTAVAADFGETYTTAKIK